MDAANGKRAAVLGGWMVYEASLYLWPWPETPAGYLVSGLGRGQLADLLGVHCQPPTPSTGWDAVLKSHRPSPATS